MSINPLIFRAYDIRGIADSSLCPKGSKADLTEESVYLIGKAAATHLIQKYQAKTIAVGMDNRLTGPTLKAAYIKGLREIGMDVTDIGIATSPMLYWTVCALKFDAGTNITASHNPKEYNGLKIVSQNAHSVCGPELQELVEIIETEAYAKTEKQGSLETLDVWGKYLKDLSSHANINRKLKVVVDCGNGTAGKFAPELLRHIGCDVTELYCELDGNFPNHEANPEEIENMRDLIAKVKETNSDLGIGFDGDGDRVGVVNEKGELYSSDFMLLLLARDLLTRQPGAQIVFDVKVSQAIINNIKCLGGIPVMSKTGHSFIESKMKEIGAPLAGEVSGHLFFAENYYGFDDAFLASIKIIELLSQETHPLSQMFNDLPKTFTTPEIKIPCPDEKKFAIVGTLVAHFTKLYPSITIDGVRTNFTENSWGAVRASNTSPNLTLRFEADTKEQLEKIKEEMFIELRKHPEITDI